MGLLALAVTVKPLADVVRDYICSDSYEEAVEQRTHVAHLLPVARVEKGSEISITQDEGRSKLCREWSENRKLNFLHLPLDKNCKRDYYTKQTDNGAWGVFALGFFLWNVLGNASLRADRGGPQRKIGMRAAAEWCLPGRKREKGEGIMNENVDGMMIRLVGLALAVLLMAGMTIYTDLFKKTSDMDAHAAVISVQDGHVAAEDVQWNA